MKTTMKYLTLAASMIFAVGVSAQEPAPAAQLSDYHEGDVIVIKRDHERYLTGEKMSNWVYNVEHTIQQVGSKRWPNGILIRGIYSWVAPDDIVNKTTHPEQTTQEQAAKQEEQKPAEVKPAEQKPAEVKPAEQKPAEVQPAEVMPAEVKTITPEQAQRDSLEAAVRQRIDSITQELKAKEAEEQKQPDQQDAAFVIEHNQVEINQCDRFTIGLRGGAATLMHETDKMGKWHLGFDVLLDLQYAHYWKKFGSKLQYGVMTGLSAGYARSHISSSVNDQYTEVTSGGTINYSVLADNVKEYDGQLQLEIPLMFSMIHEKGFFQNVGPRFALPVYAQYNQKIDAPHINAHFVEENVTVTDAKITGRVNGDQTETKGKWGASKFNLMLGAELGYEWTFRNKNSLGLGAYVNYSVYTYYKNDTNNKSLVGIVARPDTGKPAVVEVLSATDTYAKGLGYLDFGVKVAYHFNWWK